jgi:hypothetical protein
LAHNQVHNKQYTPKLIQAYKKQFIIMITPDVKYSGDKLSRNKILSSRFLSLLYTSDLEDPVKIARKL